MLKICLSLATSCTNLVYLHQKSEDNATQQCKKAPPPTSSHPPSLLTPHIQHSQNNKTIKTNKTTWRKQRLQRMLFDHRRQNEDDHRWHWLNWFSFALHSHYSDCEGIAQRLTDCRYHFCTFHQFLHVLPVVLFSLFSFLFFTVVVADFVVVGAVSSLTTLVGCVPHEVV